MDFETCTGHRDPPQLPPRFSPCAGLYDVRDLPLKIFLLPHEHEPAPVATPPEAGDSNGGFFSAMSV